MSNQGSRDKNISDAWSSIGATEVPPPLPSASEMPPPLRSTSLSAEIYEPSYGDVDNVSLAQSLLEKGYHPVMLFGTSGSGKSYLLASLFQYLQNDPWSEAICIMGEWILPLNTKKGEAVSKAASNFFNHVVMGLNSGEAVGSTHNPIPFFIPVILRPKNGKPDIKLAFLESRGENYEIRPDSAYYFPELKQDIVDVYRNYPMPISLLVIAPYTLRDAYTEFAEEEDSSSEEFKKVDKSLYGALQAYQSTRQGVDHDNYLFVLTKWDAHTKGVSNPEFSNPPVGLVEKLINERYRLAWNIFRNMRRAANSNSMQYSAGLISGDKVYEVPEALRTRINKYPRALWDWLYLNASGQALYGPSKENAPAGAVGWLKKLLS